MNKKRSRKELSEADVKLLDSLIDHLDTLNMWESRFGLLGLLRQRQVGVVLSRFDRIRERSPLKPLPRGQHTPSREFFEKLEELLSKVATRESIGTEYDKRRIRYLITCLASLKGQFTD